MSFSQQFRVPERIGGKWKITMRAAVQQMPIDKLETSDF